MRLITLKLYRAFPELDDYTDEQCVELMGRVGRNLGSKALTYAAAIGTFFLTAVATCIGYTLFAAAMESLGIKLQNPGNAVVVVVFIAIVIVFALPAFAALLVRDILVRRQVYRAVRLFLDHVRCPQCNYLLLGQRAVDGAVRCPECGASTMLAALGITEEDLIPPKDTGAVGRRD